MHENMKMIGITPNNSIFVEAVNANPVSGIKEPHLISFSLVSNKAKFEGAAVGL